MSNKIPISYIQGCSVTTIDKKNINKQIKQSLYYLKKGSQNEAQAVFNQIVSQQSIDDINNIKDVNSLMQLGALASQLGEKLAAINVFSRLVEMCPESSVYLDNLAQAYIDNDMLYSAETALKEAIVLNSELHLPYIRLAALFNTGGKYSDAVMLLEKAMKLKPSDSNIYKNIVMALTYSDRQDEAYGYAQKLIRLEPKAAENYHLLGKVLSGTGHFDEALSNFKKAIQLDATYGEAYYDFASIKKLSSEDSALIRQAEKSLQTGMPAYKRACIHFSLGKMFDDCENWGKAFEHFRQGNLIGKPAVEDKTLSLVFNKTHAAYSKKLFKKFEVIGNNSEIPVFIVGMPRSGTTLIEQILASHPECDSAGELIEIDLIQKHICSYDNLNQYKRELTKSMNAEAMSKYAEQYLQVLGNTKNSAKRVINKMPDNFLHLGLINLLFPKAHIIHVVRSPLDTCLSCYFQYFNSVPWANDLSWISMHYKLYKRAMAYWKKELPEGKVIEVHYEELVADIEYQARRLIDSIGLQWDPACLEFYKRKGNISTASVWQARQPVYTSSRKRWVNYAFHIESLANELQEYLDADDLGELKNMGVKLKKKWYLNIFKYR